MLLGFFDQKECERFHFRQKSIYQRKYHYEKKIGNMSNKFKIFLTGEEKYQLYEKVMGIDRDKMEKLNTKFC